MKKSICIATCAIMLSILFTACKKQVIEPAVNGSTVLSKNKHASGCKPTVFTISEEGIFSRRVNVMEKWYADGKVNFINMEFSDPRFAFMRYGPEHALRLPFGEVRYEGNQVYVRNPQRNYDVFRATVDKFGNALATYYYNKLDFSGDVYAYDTLYYNYTGHRLDFVIQLSKWGFGPSDVRRSWEKYIFSYDRRGNLATIHSVNQQQKLNFVYDYSRPVDGIISNYRLNIPFRVAEFLDLVPLPMHYVISEINVSIPGPNGSYQVVSREQFANFVIDNGVVYAYHNANNDAIFKKSYYTGWDCGGAETSYSRIHPFPSDIQKSDYSK